MLQDFPYTNIHQVLYFLKSSLFEGIKPLANQRALDRRNREDEVTYLCNRIVGHRGVGSMISC